MTLAGLESYESVSGDRADLQRRVVDRLIYTVGKDPDRAETKHWCAALSLAVRDHVVDLWHTRLRFRREHRSKRVYYLSLEFLIGRLLRDAISNLGMEETCREAMDALGVDYDSMLTCEADAALGNGGLGRLAACFLDSMSSLGISAIGYGIRYEHGLFQQKIVDGWQVEQAEDWLVSGHVWEFERPEIQYPIKFGGHVEAGPDGRATWHPDDQVIATAFDTPIAGWRGKNVNTLRLWAAQPVKMFDLAQFNRGDYLSAARHAVLAETISRILYPDDTTPEGKELRLKQEYFITAASLDDIIRRQMKYHGRLDDLADRVAIQLNDTHPAIAVPELIRRLVDDFGMRMEQAFAMSTETLCYTNHTLLPEALERWPYELMHRVLPRHLQIIEWIDQQHARYVHEHHSDARLASTKIIDDYGGVRMGNLAFIGSHRVNGVSALHTDLMKKTVFADLHALFPDRIVNQTNGITPRRWLYQCNPPLRELLTETIGDGWVGDLERVALAAPLADNAKFRDRFAEAKLANKIRLAAEIEARVGIRVDPNALFDVHIKRIHEYKRQLLNILETIALYNAIKKDPTADWTPRVKIFAGKAAPGYFMAKLIIKLINDVAETVNSDPDVGALLKIVYLPNYNVSAAEIIIPAADLSEQISTAGKEASGTGNMKFALNGALTIGTMDGANVEIRERVGEDNMFIFGLTAEGVADIRVKGFNSNDIINATPHLREVVEMIERGGFSPDDPNRFKAITDKLRYDDYFLVTVDFADYYATQRIADEAFQNQEDWMRRAVLNTANVGWFSSDRTIRGYARDMWNIPVGSD